MVGPWRLLNSDEWMVQEQINRVAVLCMRSKTTEGNVVKKVGGKQNVVSCSEGWVTAVPFYH